MKEPRTLGFTFQEVSLEEASAVWAAGGGKYAELIFSVMGKLRELDKRNDGLPLAERKTFVFGLPGGKALADTERKRLSNSLGLALRRHERPWVIRYSGAKKVFVCLPSNSNEGKPPKKIRAPSSAEPSTKTVKRGSQKAQIIAMLNQKIRPMEIAKQLGIQNGYVYKIRGELNRQESKS